MKTYSTILLYISVQLIFWRILISDKAALCFLIIFLWICIDSQNDSSHYVRYISYEEVIHYTSWLRISVTEQSRKILITFPRTLRWYQLDILLDQTRLYSLNGFVNWLYSVAIVFIYLRWLSRVPPPPSGR